MSRAERSGIRLSADDASIVKGMVGRGDRHHDIAAWFGVNQGRIAQVIAGDLHPNSPIAPKNRLPPSGPYTSGQSAQQAVDALEKAQSALAAANKSVEDAVKSIKKR